MSGSLSRRGVARALLRAGMALAGLALFVLALEVMKHGASGIAPLLRGMGATGRAGSLGAGWLGACLLLSGSPVAALALALLAAGALSTPEAFFMIGGSRLGAAFVVLVIGVLADLRARSGGRSAYIGVTALVATALVYLPALALAWAGLEGGALAGLRLAERAPASGSLVAALLGARFGSAPRALVFVAGLLLLLAAFKALDQALPDLEGRASPLLPADHVVYRPWFMFGVGLATTAVTLSVSVSLSVLVPLAARGFVRRENVWPYVLGANVTTLIDTLLAGALVGHPDGARMVALLMLSVGGLSLLPVFLFPYAFARLVDRAARLVTSSPRALVLFAAALFAVPLLLIVLF